MAIQKSPLAALLNLFSMISHGVKRSLKLITQKSWERGAPKTAPPLSAAVTPEITSMFLKPLL